MGVRGSEVFPVNFFSAEEVLPVVRANGPEHPAGVACGENAGGNVPGDDASRADDGVAADVRPGQNDGPGPDPDAIADMDISIVLEGRLRRPGSRGWSTVTFGPNRTSSPTKMPPSSTRVRSKLA